MERGENVSEHLRTAYAESLPRYLAWIYALFNLSVPYFSFIIRFTRQKRLIKHLLQEKIDIALRRLTFYTSSANLLS